MSEKSFREDIAGLDYNEHKGYVAEVIPTASKSGSSEMFNVNVFRMGNRAANRGNYYLQWTRHERPELPKLKREVDLKGRSKFKNWAFLTSGFGTSANTATKNGMKNIDTLVLVIKELKNLGIIINI